MTKKTLIAASLGALILFAWNAFSWMALPFHSNTLNSIPESALDEAALKKQLTKEGVYHYPGLPESGTLEEWNMLEEKVKAGPRITLMVYRPGATELFSGRLFGLNFIFNILTAFILLYVLQKNPPAGRLKVIGMSLLIGCLTCFAKELPHMTWYLYPMDYIITEVSDTLVSFLLLGVFYAFFAFKPQTA